MFNNKSVLAIIPARGGSKSIQRKNIKPLGGKPLIAYTIEESLKSKYIDRVVLSTDDKEIAKVAMNYGAEAPFLRPKELAKDTSSSLSAILHALEYLEREKKYSPDIIVFLQPTSPFRRAKHIDEGIEKIEGCDAVVGVSEVKDSPYFMMQKKGEFLKPFLEIKDRPLRRQDLPKLHHDNASLFIAKREYYNSAKDPDPVAPIFEGRVRGVFMDEISSIDINSILDFLLAEIVLKNKENGRNSRLYENRPYLIAECAYSHEGDIEYLKKSVKKISETGCVNAVKFHVLSDIQTYMSSEHDLYEKVQEWLFNEDEWKNIIDYAISLKLDVITLADDLASLDFLKPMADKLSAIEIHACSLNDIKMLNKVSKFSIPIILGTGGSIIDEISFAINYLKKKGKSDIILMYGFQNYPTKYRYINLKKMQKIKELFDLPIGYADHTSWNDENQELITLAGFLSGANIIEKHFVLKKGENRIDYEAAISAEDFCNLYEKLDILQKAIGDGGLELNRYEKEYGKIGPMKKAIVAGKDMEKDEEILLENLTFKRTKSISNIKQKEVQNLLKRKAKDKIRKNELISFENTYPSEERR